MKALIFATGAALLSVLTSAAPSAAADPVVLGGIEWNAVPADGGAEPHFRIGHKSSSSDITLADRAEFGAARSALGGAAGPVSFTVVHEAGTLVCSGTLTRAFEGEGRCRFSSDPRFEAALADRELAPDDRSDLLAMLLTDVTIELADGLTREGVKPEDANDLIAAAALHLTPAYVRDINSGPLKLTQINDAFAYKALGVDGAYLRGLAEAGYTNLSPEDVMGMKATGITPEYAGAMNRAATGSTQ